MKVAEKENLGETTLTSSTTASLIGQPTLQGAAAIEKAAVETLEQRQHMSVSLENGVLGVSGLANESNAIHIRSKNGHVHAFVNGEREGAFRLAGVKSIQIVGGSKADYIEVDQKIAIPVGIKGLAGDDRIIAGSGRDTILGGDGRDTIYGGAGNDVINGNDDDDRIYGGAGHDSINGASGQDIAYGESGDDQFLQVEEIDKILGGGGRDKMTLKSARKAAVASSTSKDHRKPYVESFTLIDASTGKAVKGFSSIQQNAVLNLAQLPSKLNIQANLAGGSSKVRFDYDGKKAYRIEGGAPYALASDNNGTFNAMKFTEGTHTLSAHTMTGDQVLNTSRVSFKVVRQATVGETNPTPSSQGPTTGVDQTIPLARIAAVSTTIPAGHAVHVDALLSKLNAGNWQEGDYAWDFGDAGSAFNEMKGFNAAHSYRKAGQYTITLKVTNKLGKSDAVTINVNVTSAARRVIYVSNDGSDSNSGRSASSPIRTVAKAMQLLDTNTEILFARGDTFTMKEGMAIHRDNVLIGSYGIGERPKIIWNGPRDSSAMFSTGTQSQNITIQDLSLDSIYNKDTNDDGTPVGIRPGGTNITFQRNTLLNLMHGANLNLRPDGFLFHGNDAPLKTGIRKYFVWAEGSHVTLVGNHAANSTREHIVRVNYVSKINVSHNDFTNLNRQAQGDQYDIQKTALNMQSGDFAYMGFNKLQAAWQVGPLGKETGIEDVSRRFKYAIGEFNELSNDPMEINHGAEHIMIRHNVFHNDGRTAINVDGYEAGPYNRGVKDLTLLNNTAKNDSTRGVFLRVWGPVDGIRLINNLYVAPNLTIGSYETAAVKVEQGTLESFTEIDGNVWPDAGRTLDWVGEQAMFFLGSNYGNVSGFKTLGEWNAQKVVGSDSQQNASIGATYSIHHDGTVVGARVAA